VRALQVGGVAVIQPGIESLATSLLDRMAKGVKGRQNIALLRYARSVGMVVKWNLLGGLPGDLRSDYELLRDLVPLLTHLYPPNALSGLMIDRFSPYFVAPADHGIDNLRPWPAYAAIYPRDADHAALAYHFDGDYPTATTTEMDVMAALFQRVTAWRDAWTGREPPVLQARAMGPRRFGLWDSRGLGGPSFRQLTPAQARTVLVGGHPDRTPLAGWAVREGYAVMLDGRVVPLAVAPPGLLAQLETERTKASAPASVLPAG
jgi:hypothetical protein